MKPLLLTVSLFVLACSAPTSTVDRHVVPGAAVRSSNPGTCTIYGKTYARGFDDLGYNRCASQFVGAADGVDGMLDGAIYGDPTYANDHLVMKWNDEWDRGNAEAWTNPPYDAYLDNEWNGILPGGSGYTEHFKTRWSAACAGGSPPAGTDCIWGDFEVLMDQGTVPGGAHEWWWKQAPAGYGAK